MQETRIWAKFEGEPVLYHAFSTGDVDGILESMDAMTQANGQSVDHALNGLIEAFKHKFEFLPVSSDYARSLSAATVLWAACRLPRPESSAVEEAAREGGKSIGMDIAHTGSGGLYDFNVYVHNVGDVAGHA